MTKISTRTFAKSIFLVCLVTTLSVARLFAQVPTITTFSPATGPVGTSVTITGTNFNTTAANNIVFFGATMATVTAAGTTSLTVTVPAGATYQPISVLNGATALIGYSASPFATTFTPTKGSITTADIAAKVDFATGTNPQSIVIGDLDGDGKPDLVVANNSSNTVSVYRNTSSSGSITVASFAAKVDFATGTGPVGVAIGDLDGDGKPDLAVLNSGSATVSVFRNTSSSGSITAASFSAKVDFATGGNPGNVAIGDLDGDGKPDLAVANQNSFSVLRNTSTSGSITASSFAAKVDFATATGLNSLAIGDLDGDGKPDLAVANQTRNTVSVFRNTSSSGSITAASFAAKVDFATGGAPLSVAIGDLDGDGKPDLAVANSGALTVSVFRNTSTSGSITAASFAAKVDFTTGQGPCSVAIGDLDGDGKPDLAVANLGVNTVSILRNTSSSGSITVGSFAAKVDFATGNVPYSVVIGDLDGDGKPDLALANSSSNTVSVLRNSPVFPPPTVTSFSPSSGPVGTSVTITGTFFNTTTTNNIVFFGPVKATVTAATATSLTVTVPTGASYAPITVLNTGTTLAAYSNASFSPIFSPNKVGITTADIAAAQNVATGTLSWSASMVDIDGDGKPDLLVPNESASGTFSVLLNTGTPGSPSFASRVVFSTIANPENIAIGDLDGDGKPDIVIVGSNNAFVSVMLNTSTVGNVSFGTAVQYVTGGGPRNILTRDIDGDGKPDIVTANYLGTAKSVSVLLNTSTLGAQSFAAKVDISTVNQPFGLAAGDLDGDGKPDLVVGDYSNSAVRMMLNTSTPGVVSFGPNVVVATGSTPYAVAIGDLDGDGKLDIAVTDQTVNTVSLLHNKSTVGVLSFDATADIATGGSFPQALAIGDIDGDGKPDIAVANANGPSITVLRNTTTNGAAFTTASFATAITKAGGNTTNGVIIGDVDGDGKLDIVGAYYNGGGGTKIFLNTPVLPPTITSFTPLTAAAGRNGYHNRHAI